MWRPSDWKNPYELKRKEERLYAEGGDMSFIAKLEKARVFEAGADAMYKPAYEKGRRELLKELRDLAKEQEESEFLLPLNSDVGGCIVFIKDEEK